MEKNFILNIQLLLKIIKQRNIKDKRELSRIWQDTYGENFEEQYPALFNKLD